jgi:hypothetical protein
MAMIASRTPVRGWLLEDKADGLVAVLLRSVVDEDRRSVADGTRAPPVDDEADRI